MKMSEETKVVETKEETKVVEVSPHEETARTQGWVSKEEWVEAGRDEAEWRPAKEFVDRGDLYKSLHSTKRELKQTQAALTALQRHHQYVYDRAHKQAITDLKKERRFAMKDEDLERVEEIETEIENLEKEHQIEAVKLAQAKAQTEAAGVNPEFQQWVDKNIWYLQDSDMRDFADAQGLIYMNKNPGLPPAQVLSHVESKIRKAYPEKFGVKKAAPNAVASVDKTNKSSRKASSDFELTDLEREMMNTFVKQKIMTEEQYIAELKKAGR